MQNQPFFDYLRGCFGFSRESHVTEIIVCIQFVQKIELSIKTIFMCRAIFECSRAQYSHINR